MLTTFEIAAIALLIIAIGIAIWWYVVAKKYSDYLDTFSYARGANVSEGKTVTMSCDGDSVICVSNATQICTDRDSNNFENPETDPIASGTGSDQYGAYNSNTTVNLKTDVGKICNGKGSCKFTYTQVPYPNGMTCSGTSQLLATYTCIQSGTKCS